MNDTFREWLTHAYIGLTLPARQWRMQQLRADRRSPVFVLFYHRIADRQLTPWTITHSDFQRHLDWLSAHLDIVSYQEAQQRITSGENQRRAVAITFDDGYADNCERALPLLIERRIPCMYFVTSGFLRSRAPFPHDAKRGVPLEPNTIEQIRELAKAGIDIGAHTLTHLDLGRPHSIERLRDEIEGSVSDLQEILEKKISYFAFPYGQIANISQAAIDIIAQAGLQGFCSAYGGFNWPGDNAFHLKRIHADSGLARIRNWLTLDARKLRQQKELPYMVPTLPALTSQMSQPIDQLEKPFADHLTDQRTSADFKSSAQSLPLLPR